MGPGTPQSDWRCHIPFRPSDVSADKAIVQALPSPRNPVLRRPPVLEDYINVTSTCGERAFLVLRADLTGTGVQVCDHSMVLSLAFVPFVASGFSAGSPTSGVHGLRAPPCTPAVRFLLFFSFHPTRKLTSLRSSHLSEPSPL